jgi:hypothetical protein
MCNYKDTSENTNFLPDVGGSNSYFTLIMFAGLPLSFELIQFPTDHLIGWLGMQIYSENP